MHVSIDLIDQYERMALSGMFQVVIDFVQPQQEVANPAHQGLRALAQCREGDLAIICVHKNLKCLAIDAPLVKHQSIGQVFDDTEEIIDSVSQTPAFRLGAPVVDIHKELLEVSYSSIWVARNQWK
jgi:hypothetical protein